MNKRLFVQSTAPLMLVAQLMRGEKGDTARAIAWAESLWDRLCQAGYGSTKPTGPREMQDHVSALPPALSASFDRLWRAYQLPKGKQDAAQRWGQIAPDDDLAARIIEAAAAEAREPRENGAARKWLQGWLTERRWEDRTPPSKAAQDDDQVVRRARIAELLSDRRRLLDLVGHDAAGTHADDLARVEADLVALGVSQESLATPAAAPRKSNRPVPLRDLVKRAAPVKPSGDGA